MKLAKTLLLLLALTFLVPYTYAQVEGASFQIQAADLDPRLCTCDTLTDQIQIINTGTFGATYTITTNLERASIGLQQVTLAPQESQTIPILISGDCRQPTSQQNYEVTVDSNIGAEQTIQRSLTQIECQTIDATLYAPNQTIGPCEAFNYTIDIRNPSTFTETYNLTSNQDAINITNNTFQIGAGQTLQQNASASFSCDVYGEQNVEFQVNAQRSQLQTTLTHNLDIERNYNFTMDSPDYGMCKFEESFRAITITNNKDFTNNYTLQLENNPRQLTLRNNTITVGPQSSELIYVDIASIERDRQGTFKLLATSSLGQVQQHIDIGYRTRNCYDLDIEFTNTQNSFCPGSHELPINITNNGEANTYTITSNQQSLSQNQITLQTNETTTIQALVNNEEQEGIRQINLQVRAQPQQTNTTKDLSTSTQLQLYSDQACTQPQATTNQRTSYDTQHLTIQVENTGIQQARYLINSQNTPEFIQPINTTTLLQPQETTRLNTTMQASIEDIGTHNFTLTLTNNQNNQVYTIPITLQVTDKPLLQKITEQITSSDCAPITTGILIVGLLLAIIILTTRLSNKGYNKGKLAGLLLIATAITLMIAAISLGSPVLTQTENNTLQVQNQTTLLMQNVFENQTNATYDVTQQPQGFTVNITNTQATITRNQNFQGNSQVRFTASQNNQTQVSTPYILTEKNTEGVSLYELNCAWTNTLLTIAILYVLLLLLPGRKNTKTTKEEPNQDKPSTPKKKEEIKTPNKNSTKKEMKKYLDKKGIPYKNSMLKKELYKLIKENKK